MDPKEIHDIDQAIASFRTLGKALAVVFHTLRAENVPVISATHIVGEYAKGLAGRKEG